MYNYHFSSWVQSQCTDVSCKIFLPQLLFSLTRPKMFCTSADILILEYLYSPILVLVPRIEYESWVLSVTDILLLTMMLLIYTVWKLTLHYISLTQEFNTYIWGIIATTYIYLYIICIMYFSTPQNPVWVPKCNTSVMIYMMQAFYPYIFIQLKHWFTILHVKPIKSSVSLA